jgi:hypothetical protein
MPTSKSLPLATARPPVVNPGSTLKRARLWSRPCQNGSTQSGIVGGLVEGNFTRLLKSKPLPECRALLHLSDHHRVVLQVGKRRWQSNSFAQDPLSRTEAMVVAQPAARLSNPVACHTRGICTNHVHILEDLLRHDLDKLHTTLHLPM